MANVNDIRSGGVTLVQSTGNDIASGPCVVMGMYVTAASGAQALIRVYNAASATGTHRYNPVSEPSDTVYWNLWPGVRFDVGLSIGNIVGTPDDWGVWYKVI